MNQVTIAVPVYGDWPSLADCLDSLKEYAQNYRVVFVNDCGPEADVIEKKLLKAIKNTKFEYFRNQHNLGFGQTCNRIAEEIETVNDLIFLNSDTMLTSGAIEELAGVMCLSPRFGAGCPRTNNASIATIPYYLSSADNKIDPRSSYEAYQAIKPLLPRFNLAPVAVGFCFYVKREVITKHGLFDMIFGSGYGEEDDFCMRIGRHGYQSVIANHAFVFHQSSRSFGEQQKNQLMKKNEKILLRRYPEFYRLVNNYLEYEQSFADYFANLISDKSGRRKILIDFFESGELDQSFLKQFLNDKKSYEVKVLSKTPIKINNKLVPTVGLSCDEQFHETYAMSDVSSYRHARFLVKSSTKIILDKNTKWAGTKRINVIKDYVCKPSSDDLTLNSLAWHEMNQQLKELDWPILNTAWFNRGKNIAKSAYYKIKQK